MIGFIFIIAVLIIAAGLIIYEIFFGLGNDENWNR